MGAKTNEQKMDEILSRSLTVDQLIEILQKFPKEAHVGAIGHFGEFHGIDKFDFNYSESRDCYVTPDGNWRNDTRRYINIVEVYQKDIGPDPD